MTISHSELVQRSRYVIRSIKSKYHNKRTTTEKIADLMTSVVGSMTFLIINILLFVGWIIINLGFIPFLQPFDNFPFGLLTMIVSLEAIVLSIFVLISQNRASKIDDLREEIDLQVDLITEAEITKLLQLNILLLKKTGINIEQDQELQEMLKDLDEEKIEKTLERQI